MAAPAHTATTEATPKGEHDGGFPPFNPQTFASQLIWLVVAFVLLYALMAKWALPKVAGVIEKRQKGIEGDLAEAARLKQQSDEAVAAYEKALADARGRAQAIANETRERQAKEAEAARKAVEDDLNTRLAQSDKAIAASKTAAMSNVRGIAEGAAAAIVERLSGSAPSEQTVAAAIADVLKR
ncbi:MAG TPA: F0F1 ATP synthase subunit B' [Pseudolabrys sp.]|nr:F0F1 ATP synthase subunit B' [Pseudolabrys sp.]